MSAPWAIGTDHSMPAGHAVHGTRKQSALEFLRLSAAGVLREAFDSYVGPNFRHHNPYFPSDAASLIKGMERTQRSTLTRSSKYSEQSKTGIS